MQPIEANSLLSGLGTLAHNPVVTSVITDSRAVTQGSLFVCIKGERTDGHLYAAKALEAGAVGIVAQHAIDGVPQDHCVLVSDSLDAIIAMSANYKAQFSPVVVGVTGSVGKTTTKEFCAAVFSAFGNTLKTLGNQNSEIGMSQTVFRMDNDTKFAVLEMGMQGMGEIDKLTCAAKPQGAIVTSIGVSHLEQLGTRENILQAKLEICNGMPQGAPLVLNADNDLLCTAHLPTHVNPVYIGITQQNVHVRATQIVTEGTETRFVIEDVAHGSFAVCLPTLGMHNVSNALCAYALGTRMGLDAAICAKALEGYEPTGHRQNVHIHKGVAVIEDCYNASPDSMRAALDTLQRYPATGKRIAVLGDMFELGTLEVQAHEEIGALTAKTDVDVLFTVGECAKLLCDTATAHGVDATHFATKEKVVEQLKAQCVAGDVVLVKASHGMAFETILSGFYED